MALTCLHVEYIKTDEMQSSREHSCSFVLQPQEQRLSLVQNHI